MRGKKILLPAVSIIIANYNGRRYFDRLFSSLNSLDYPSGRLEQIVIDNGSTDGSISWIRKHSPKTRIIRHEKNDFCSANNAGIRRAKGALIALLNNDCWVDRNWLKQLVKVLLSDKKMGAAGGKILFPDGTINSCGLQQMPKFYWHDRGIHEPDKGQYDKRQEVEALTGCALLIKKECLEEAGLLDEDFEFYVEDVDWCLRARKKGWRMGYVPQSIVWHHHQGSTTPERVKWYIERNRILLTAKQSPKDLPAAIESAAYFQEQKSIAPFCEIISLACRKMVEEHPHSTVIPVIGEILVSFAKISRSHQEAVVTTLQGELGLVRKEREQFKVDLQNHLLLKESAERSLQLLASETDAERALASQLRQKLQEAQAKFDEVRTKAQAREGELTSLLDHRSSAVSQLKKEMESIQVQARQQIEQAQEEARRSKAEADQKVREAAKEFQRQAKQEVELAQAHAKKEIGLAQAHAKKEIETAQSHAKKETEAAYKQARKEVEEAYARAKEEIEKINIQARQEVEETDTRARRQVEEIQNKSRQELEQTKNEAEGKAREAVEAIKKQTEREIKEVRFSARGQIEFIQTEAAKKIEEAQARTRQETEVTCHAQTEQKIEAVRLRARQEAAEIDAKARKSVEEAEARARQLVEQVKEEADQRIREAVKEAETRAQQEIEKAQKHAGKEIELAQTRARTEIEAAQSHAKQETQKAQEEARKRVEEADARTQRETERVSAGTQQQIETIRQQTDKQIEQIRADAREQVKKAEAEAE
ncbi:MAG: glycosyltransferase, partial [Candidatus Omnitrophica bacterium]|nr:glycosyltransferase [Candidatus Omnitrophota bacterium]